MRSKKNWTQGIFGSHSSQALQYIVFFYNCKLFGLKAFDEHKNLECSQFEIGQDEQGKCIRFTGRSSKISIIPILTFLVTRDLFTAGP